MRFRAHFIFAISVLFLFAISASAQRTERIKFSRGATSTIVIGTLNGWRDKRNYVIRVRPGQTIRTEQVGMGHAITIFITSPTGEDVNDSDASCNNRREVSPTAAGDYQIQVVECKKADRWKGTFKFRVTVR